MSRKTRNLDFHLVHRNAGRAPTMRELTRSIYPAVLLYVESTPVQASARIASSVCRSPFFSSTPRLMASLRHPWSVGLCTVEMRWAYVGTFPRRFTRIVKAENLISSRKFATHRGPLTHTGSLMDFIQFLHVGCKDPCWTISTAFRNSINADGLELLYELQRSVQGINNNVASRNSVLHCSNQLGSGALVGSIDIITIEHCGLDNTKWFAIVVITCPSTNSKSQQKKMSIRHGSGKYSIGMGLPANKHVVAHVSDIDWHHCLVGSNSTAVC